MRKRKLGRTGLEISEIGFGALEIGRPWGVPVEGDFAVPSEKEVAALLDRVLELGINLIDTAPAYLLSEERLGKLFSHRRKEFYLATKCGESFNGYQSRYDFSSAGTTQFIETSLRRLRTDHLDLLQTHCGPDEVETIRRGEVLEAMLRARQEGKVRWLGVSCHAPGALVALEMRGYDVLQVPYSLLNRAIEEKVLPRAAEAGVGIIVREPLERGKLTEKSRNATDEDDPALRQAQEWLAHLEARRISRPLSQIALQFVLRDARVSTVLVGTRSIRHLEAAVAATQEAFDPGLLADLTTPSPNARPARKRRERA